MVQLSIEFDGIRNLPLLLTLLVSIAGIMIAAGLWRLVQWAGGYHASGK